MSEFLILDGGMATELAKAGFNYDCDPLWSARALDEHPYAIQMVNLSFLQHGADVICTNTYQASVKGFQDHLRKSKKEAEELIHFAVQLATETCQQFWKTYRSQNADPQRKRPLVVGSVGPYGAFLHDGSEYTGDYVDNLSIQDLKNWHRSMVKILLDSGVDMIAFETIPAQDGEHTSHGEKFVEAVSSVVKNSPQIVAVGVNCCAPEIVKPLLESIHGRIKRPFVIYPNSGEEWRDGKWSNTGKCESIASHVPEWVKLGARWIGGCCRTTPLDIADIRNVLYECAGS